MAGYGFRLYAVEVFVGMKRTAQAFDDVRIPLIEPDEAASASASAERSVDYRKLALADVTAKIGRTHSFGMVASADDGGANHGTGVSVRFTQGCQLPAAEILRLKLEHGLHHADGVLIDPADASVPDTPLKNKSTLYPFRASLITGAGYKRALLAVETRGRACPVVGVVRGLNAVSSEGLRLRALSHLAGEAAMMEFIRNANIEQVVFEKFGYDDDGARSRREVAMSVRARIEPDTVREHLVGWARDYFGFQKQFLPDPLAEQVNDEEDLHGLTAAERAAVRRERREARKAANGRAVAADRERRRDGAHEAAEAVKQAIFTARGEEVDIDFTDVGVEMSTSLTKRTLKPFGDFQKLTYGIGETIPGDERFYSLAESTAQNLLKELQNLAL